MVTAVSPELTQLFQSQEENLTFNSFFTDEKIKEAASHCSDVDDAPIGRSDAD